MKIRTRDGEASRDTDDRGRYADDTMRHEDDDCCRHHAADGEF